MYTLLYITVFHIFCLMKKALRGDFWSKKKMFNPICIGMYVFYGWYCIGFTRKEGISLKAMLIGYKFAGKK